MALLAHLSSVSLALILSLIVSGGITGCATAQADPGSEGSGELIMPPDRAEDPSIRPEWVERRRSWSSRDAVTAEESTVTVSGNGRVEASPDRAHITLAVETEARSAREAGEANAATMSEVTGALQSVGDGISGFRLETTGYHLTPRYGPSREAHPREIIGYTARNSIQITVDDLERVGHLVDAGLSAGANRISNLRFEVRDTAPHRWAALTQAVERAHAEAEALAAALGMRLGIPLEVQGGAEVPPPRPFEARMEMLAMESADAPSTPIGPGMQEISANVTIRFQLEPGR